jgi:hypothetical protein
MTPEFDRVIN